MDNFSKAALQRIDVSLENLSQTFRNLNIHNLIDTFNGNDSYKTRQWLQSIESLADIIGLTDQDKIAILYVCSRGVLSEYLRRLAIENNGVRSLAWDFIKEIVIRDFAFVTEPTQARDALRKIKQGKHETLAIFAQRIEILGEFAFPKIITLNHASRVIFQSQLVDFFVQGLECCQLKFKVLEEKCNTLREALSVAQEEEISIRRLNACDPTPDAQEIGASNLGTHRRRLCGQFRNSQPPHNGSQWSIFPNDGITAYVTPESL